MSFSSNILLSSKYRNRIQYPNPCSFVMSTSSQSLQGIQNPVTSNYPLYNFCFCSRDKFECSIISIQDSKIILSDEIFNLIGKTNLNSNKISLSSIENSFDILKGLYIEIDIADNLFHREIISFDPTDKSVVIKNPFPFVMNQVSSIPCFITNRSTNTEIIMNGKFFQENDFLYHGDDIILYNLRTNEFRHIDSRNENSLKLESSFSTLEQDDQFFVFFSSIPPKRKGKILKQENINKYHSYQYGRVQIITNGKDYKNFDRCILKPINETFDSNIDYHEYKVVNVSTIGSIDPSMNLELVKIGSQQILEKNVEYEIICLDRTISDICVFKTLSLLSFFELDLDHSSVQYLKNKYFMPIVMTNQFVLKNNELYVQPNNSILNYDVEKVRNINEFEKKNGIFEIFEAYKLENDHVGVKVRLFTDLDKVDAIENISDISESIYQGVTNFLIIEDINEGCTPLFTNNLNKNLNYKIKLQNIVIPNLSIKNTNMKVFELPYLLLDVRNKTQASNTNKNTIQSNNFEVSKTKFLLTIEKENIDPSVDFLKLSCGISSQKISFDPYDNLEIELKLPNGNIVEFDKKEHLLPILPNDKLEIVSLFEITQ